MRAEAGFEMNNSSSCVASAAVSALKRHTQHDIPTTQETSDSAIPGGTHAEIRNKRSIGNKGSVNGEGGESESSSLADQMLKVLWA
jgi:hypothetical protein